MPVTRQGKVSSGQFKNLAMAGLDRGLILSAQLAAQRATRKAPIETGRLKRSITPGRPYSSGANRRTINIGTNVEYAAVHEFGHTFPEIVIRPRVKQALAFEWPGAPSDLKPSKSGKYVFKHVTRRQFTVKARPYLRPAIRESRRDAIKIITRSVVGAVS